MKKLILLVFTCSFFFSYASYAQNKVLDAGSAYHKIFDNDKFAFIDALAKSNDPQSFIPYFSKYIGKVHVSRIILMEDMMETVYPKYPQIATIFALYLCYGEDLNGIVPILNYLPKTKQYFKTITEEQKKSADLDNVLNGGEVDKNVVVLPGEDNVRAIVFSDGRILLLGAPRGWDDVSNLSIDKNSILYKGELNQSELLFLYNPNGVSYYGKFKDADTGRLDVNLDNFEEHKNVEFYTGSMYDHEGKCLGSKWGQYSSKEQLEVAYQKYCEERSDAEKAREKAKEEAKAKENEAYLISKYGSKVMDALYKHKLYIGMPIGVFNEIYSSAHIQSGYHTYFDLEQGRYLTYMRFGGCYELGYPFFRDIEAWFYRGKLVRWKF